MVAATVASTLPSSAASTGIGVSLQVASTTRLDVTGCPATARRFGMVQPGSSAVTGPCTISFGSTNDSSMLKMYQRDGAGNAMAALSNGTPDVTMSGDGYDTITFPGGAVANWSVMQPDGKLLVAGHSNPSTDSDFSIARYDPATGLLDPTFGTGGRVVMPIDGTENDEVWTGLLQSDGKIVLAGFVAYFFGLNRDMAIVRLNADGTPDTTFGTNGIAVHALSLSEHPRDIDLTEDGGFLLTGVTYQWDDGTTGKGFLTKLRSDGRLETSFGTNGSVIIDTSVGAHDGLVSTTILDDDKLLVVGDYTNGGQKDLYASRRLSTGAIDATYGVGGIATVDFSAVVDDGFGLPQVDAATGEALVSGHVGGDAYTRRLLGTGAVDTSWGTNGTTSYDYSSRGDSSYGTYSPDMQRLVVTGGSGGTYPDGDWHVTGLGPTGLDTSWSGDGRFTYSFGAWDYGNWITPGTDGALWATGTTNGDTTPSMAIIRFATSAGGVVPDYGGGAVFGSAPTQSAFGACLEARSGAGVTGGWTVDPGGSCTAVVGDPWTPIADRINDPTAKVLGSPTVGLTSASATIRFGVKAGTGLTNAVYTAPVTVDIIAPNA